MRQESDLASGRSAKGRRLFALLPYLLLLPVYVFAAKLGLRLAIENPSATPVWPPTGIAIAAILLLGYRVWPLILVGAFLVNITTAGNFASSLGIAAGNTLEGLVAAFLVQRLANGRFAFDRPMDTAKFVLFAALLSTTLSATIGVASLVATGYASWDSIASVWRTWWLGDATGALIVAPPIIVWAAHPIVRWSFRRAIEAGFLFVLIAFSTLIVFDSTHSIEGSPFAQTFLCLPPMVWIAFRFFPRVATTATLVFGTIVLAGTLARHGPFASFDRETALLLAQAFTGVVAVTAMLLSSATHEMLLAEQAVRESEDRFRTLADSSPSMIWVSDPSARCTFLNKTWLDFTARSEEQDLGLGWIESVHPDDADALLKNYSSAFSTQKNFRADFRLKRADGVYRWVMSTGNPRFLSDGSFAGYVGMCVDISDRKRHEEELEQEALHDPLTGLPNRTLFLNRLGQSLRASKRQSAKSHGLLYLDIDRFKLINDTLGHGVGDELLVETGRRIEAILRPGDTVARLAGDEFAVLLEDVSDLCYAEDVAKRIEGLFHKPYLLSGEEFFASASIGITLIGPRHNRPVDVIQDADTAMYRAKALGRKRYQVYEGDSHKPVVEVLRLEADLRRTLESDGLDVHYQPIYSLETRTIVGFEALVRWEHPQKGMLLPSEFIPVAEQTGLISELDRQVLRKACQQMGDWHRRHPGIRPLTINVNVSVRLFSQIDVVKIVAEALAAADLDGSHLRLEVTESVFMENKDSVADALGKLRAIGVGVALDDFGTGYSSLSSLSVVPIDSLKIDRSFVADLKDGGSGAMIAQAIVNLAHALNLSVTAEGVENDQELAAIRDLHCDFAQGYYFGRPVPNGDAAAMLR